MKKEKVEWLKMISKEKLCWSPTNISMILSDPLSITFNLKKGRKFKSSTITRFLSNIPSQPIYAPNTLIFICR